MPSIYVDTPTTHSLEYSFAHGQCNDRARQSLRITFHDAIGYSTSLWTSKKYGFVIHKCSFAKCSPVYTVVVVQVIVDSLSMRMDD